PSQRHQRRLRGRAPGIRRLSALTSRKDSRMAFNKHVLLARLFASMMDPGVQQRLDSIGTAVFARQFELIEQEITRTEFSPLKSEEFIPYDTSAPAGTQSITHRTVTQTGNADFVDHYADDLPHADIYAEEFTVKVEDLG